MPRPVEMGEIGFFWPKHAALGSILPRRCPVETFARAQQVLRWATGKIVATFNSLQHSYGVFAVQRFVQGLAAKMKDTNPIRSDGEHLDVVF